MRPGLHGQMHLQVTVDVSIGEVDPPRVRAFGIDCKYLHTVSIKAELHLMRFGETLDMFIAVPHQANLNIVLCIDGKRVVDNRSTACSEGQSLEVVFLCEIRRHQHNVRSRCAHGPPHGEPADFLRCSQVSFEQCR